MTGSDLFASRAFVVAVILAVAITEATAGAAETTQDRQTKSPSEDAAKPKITWHGADPRQIRTGDIPTLEKIADAGRSVNLVVEPQFTRRAFLF